jgi:hypothetical protein
LHEQNENSSDQGGDRADKFRMESWHHNFPVSLAKAGRFVGWMDASISDRGEFVVV